MWRVRYNRDWTIATHTLHGREVKVSRINKQQQWDGRATDIDDKTLANVESLEEENKEKEVARLTSML